jgi:diguanylate cyclase (GGDEF)-like protein/PAS domain S-box-containing protein
MENNVLYKNLLDHVYEGIYFVDVERKISFWNQGAERITGFSASEVVGRHCYDNILNHVDESGNKLCIGGCPLHATIEDGINRDSRVYLHHKLGHRVTVKVKTTPLIENGVTIGAVELFVDEAGEFADLFELGELREIAYRDQLTGLPNRRFLDQHVLTQLDMAHKLDLTFGLAMLDIDFFKKVNDTYGHLIGDETLKMLAKTLTNALRGSDVLGRWGGEEFILVLPSLEREHLGLVCEKLRMLVENSVVDRSGFAFNITISIGATLMLPGDTMASLVERADGLLYESKRNGRNRVTIG